MRKRRCRFSWSMVVCCTAAVALGCSKSESASGAKQGVKKTDPGTPEPAQPATATPKPAPATPVAPVADQADERGRLGVDLVEVEIFGSISGKPSSGKLMIYTAVGDCLADDANMLDRVPGGENFMIEVFAPWGSDLTVCAVVDPGEGKPAVLYGKWKQPLHAEGEGEVMFHDVAIELAKGKPHRFPEPRRPGDEAE